MVILKKEKKKESTAFIPNYYMHQVFCLMYVDKEISLSFPFGWLSLNLYGLSNGEIGNPL
jgi:hypothetical protein